MAGLAADVVVIVHLAFVGFVVFGGFLALRWPRLAWAHVPAALWGVGIEWSGGICPLTPLEQSLRARAGRAPYEGDFIAEWLFPVLYPDGLTRDAQLVLGGAALAMNVVAYGLVWRRVGVQRKSPL